MLDIVCGCPIVNEILVSIKDLGVRLPLEVNLLVSVSAPVAFAFDNRKDSLRGLSARWRPKCDCPICLIEPRSVVKASICAAGEKLLPLEGHLKSIADLILICKSERHGLLQTRYCIKCLQHAKIIPWSSLDGDMEF